MLDSVAVLFQFAQVAVGISLQIAGGEWRGGKGIVLPLPTCEYRVLGACHNCTVHGLLNHVDGKRHLAVASTAKYGAMTYKVTRFVRRQSNVRRSTFIDLQIEIQLADAYAVRYICALQNEVHRHTFFQCYFCGFKLEPFGGNLNALWRGLCGGRATDKLHAEQNAGQSHEQHVPLLHKLS